MNDWLLIFLMATATYLPRYLPFALAGKVSMPPMLERALDYVPIAVLTAIIAQAAIIQDGHLDISLENHHALAALAAFVVALAWRNLFLTIAVGLVSFSLLRLLG